MGVDLEAIVDFTGATMSKSPTAEPRVPVVEIFGPTIQGEGADQGVPCHFVRFGGCDYKCEWCDSPHAVLPQFVRQAHKMSFDEIISKVKALSGAKYVVLSGGNPALHELSALVRALQNDGYRVSAETQGTRWKNWLWQCDRVAVSPKPPSSGHITDMHQLEAFMDLLSIPAAFLKIVIFDQEDLKFAKKIHDYYPEFKMYLSAGNDAGATVGNPDRKDERTEEAVAEDLIVRGRKLANWVMIDPDLADVQVQMQQHVLYWGNSRGR